MKYILILVYAMIHGGSIEIDTTKPLGAGECNLARSIIISDYQKMVAAELKGGKSITDKYLIAAKCEEVRQ